MEAVDEIKDAKDAVPSSSSQKKDPPESPVSPLRSPDNTCAICLGGLENKSFTDSCFHEFCFSCLLEWSKVKAECPLCKQPFKSIIHSVRSNYDYDQYFLRSEFSWEAPSSLRTNILESRSASYVSFRYRSLDFLHFSPVRRIPRNTTSGFRRHVYDQNLWVQPLTSDRYRETSPQFYRENPACMHRLIPWLNRELVALLYNNEDQVGFLIDVILELIVRYDIQSPEVHVHIEPYLIQHTDHFIHEFYNFARSPHDMEAYDRQAKYEKRTRSRWSFYSSPTPQQNRHHNESPHLSRDERTGNSSSRDSTPHVSVITPSPPPSSSTLPNRDLESGLPGSSTMNYTPHSPAYSSHSSDCIIVDEINPKNKKPIDVICLSSGSDTEIDVTALSSSSPIPVDLSSPTELLESSCHHSSSKAPGLNYSSIISPLKKRRAKKLPSLSDSSDTEGSFKTYFPSIKKRKRHKIYSASEEEEKSYLSDEESSYFSDSSDDFIPKKIPSVVKKVTKPKETKRTSTRPIKKHKKHKKHKHCKHKLA